MADAHAALRRLPRPAAGRSTLRAVVNQAATSAEGAESLDQLAASARQFLGLVVSPLGYVRSDPGVPRSVRARRPFLLADPAGPASRCVRKVARTLLEERRPRPRRSGFFDSLAARWAGARRAAL
jgi:flagellar biosynthesis protein FlhG